MTDPLFGSDPFDHSPAPDVCGLDGAPLAESSSLGHLSARLTTLGPAATLARGYAVVQTVAGNDDGRVVSTIADAPPGSQLRIRVSDGALSAAVLGATPAAGRSKTVPDTAADPESTSPTSEEQS